jgi:serine/threonine protein kinase
MQDYDQESYCPCCGAESGFQAADVGQIPVETILSKRFIIGEVISRDRIGFTYLSWDALLERKVVIKEWFPVKLAERGENRLDVKTCMKEELWEDLNQQFLKRAEVLHNLQKVSAIVPIFTFFRENGTSYYVMEYLEGHTLRSCLEKENPLKPAKAQEIMSKVQNALKILHEAGILHGNLSPDNIFLCRNGEIKFLNFAWFSKELEEIQYTVFLGKYAPFAFFKMPVRAEESLDDYGFYAVYYRLLTGEEPVGAFRRIKKDELPSISDYGLEVPAQLEKEILKGLGKAEKSGGGLLKFLQILNGCLVAAAVVLGIIIMI